MGAGSSLNEEVAVAKDITVKFAASFAKHYSKSYILGIVREQKKIIAKEVEGPKWKLLKCNKTPDAPIRHQGVLLKRSKHLKKWNPRYFVVRGDWIIDFYETEDAFKAGKVRGTVNMTGYQVCDDLNNTLISRLKALAEKVKLDLSQLPKPEEFPDFTLELFHERRESMYLQAANAEEFKKWVEMFKEARWYGPRFNITDDKIHPGAFSDALWRSRWECDMWGWWWCGGGEVMMIADAINEKIGYEVMGRVDAKLTMPWAARSRLRDGFMKSTSGFVTSAVDPMWKAAYEAVGKSRDTFRAKIKEMVKPLVEKQKEIETKIVDGINESTKSTLEEKVNPHLAALLDAVFSPVVDAFKLIPVAFDKAVGQGKEKYTKREDRLYLVWHHNYQSDWWTAYWKLGELYEPLWDIRRVFDDVSPWEIMNKARRRLRKALDNALFTFETRHEENPEKGWEATAAEVRALLVDDCRAAVLRILGMILFEVVYPLWNKLVITPGRAVVKPLADVIPDLMKDFLDPNEMLTSVANAILRGACANVFTPYASKIEM